jgi:hypothetical protein
LAELVTLQRVIEEVARVKFLRENDQRSRLPKGFRDASALYLTASENGSFVAHIDRAPTETPYQFNAVFDGARDESLDALRAALNDMPLPSSFPGAAADYLGDIGRRLREDEWIEIRSPKEGVSPVRINQQLRKKMALLVNVPIRVTEDVEGEVVSHIDNSSVMQVVIRLQDGLKVAFSANDADRKHVLQAITNRPISRLRVSGTVSYTANAQPLVESVREVTVTEHRRADDVRAVWTRIDSLKALPSIWHDDGCLAPSELALERAKRVLARVILDTDLPRPSVFPTETGGIQAEWKIGNWVVEVEVAADVKQINVGATNVVTRKSINIILTMPTQVSPDNAYALTDWLNGLRKNG